MIDSIIPPKAGISFKMPYYDEVLKQKPSVPWFEIHPENLRSGIILDSLTRIRADYPLSLHSVGLSLGSTSMNKEHLFFLKSLIERLDPGLVSDHVSWSYVDGAYVNDLLPLPYTEEALETLVFNIEHTQDCLKKEILIENPSSYLQFNNASYTEWDFISEVVKRSGCHILLDINNVYVSAHNHGFDAKAYIKSLSKTGKIKEIHLAGHKEITFENKSFLIDHHGSPVSDEVWQLYDYSLDLIGSVPTLVEWDNHLPPFDFLWAEAKKAQLYMEKVNAPLPVTI